jgi:hypothetical protein
MDTTIISWTPTNWVTIFLMAVGGFLVLKLAIVGIQKATGQNAAA